MTAEHEPELSPIFIAASPAEADFVERLLDDEGIEFAIRPEAFLRAPIGGVCLLGILFEVRAGQRTTAAGFWNLVGLRAVWWNQMTLRSVHFLQLRERPRPSRKRCGRAQLSVRCVGQTGWTGLRASPYDD